MLRRIFGSIIVIALLAAAGVGGGLMYGLVIDPIQYTDIDVQDLRVEYQADYLYLISADYAQTGELETARARLDQIGFSPQTVAGRAQVADAEGHPLAPAVAKLAYDLGAGSPALEAAMMTPTATVPPRFTPTATATATPTATRPPTRTPRPTRTPGPTVTAVVSD